MEHSSYYNTVEAYYTMGAWDRQRVANAVAIGVITADEMIEILGDDVDVETLRAAKVSEISKACNAVIIAGFDIQFDDEVAHFNLSMEDQANIANLFRVVELGGTEFPYQSDGGICRIYTRNEIARIYVEAQTLITVQTTYHNALKAYLLNLQDAAAIASVTYGMPLPEPYASEMNAKLEIAQEQMDAIIRRLGDQQ